MINYCDDENNNADCNWDGGACCNNNTAGWDNYCSACECLDPNAGSGLDCEDKWKTKKCQKKANKGNIMTGSVRHKSRFKITTKMPTRRNAARCTMIFDLLKLLLFVVQILAIELL